MPYMGSQSTMGSVLGAGGIGGIVALILGAVVVSRSMAQANVVSAGLATTPEGPARQALVARALGLRSKGLLFARIVSILLLLATILMASAAYL